MSLSFQRLSREHEILQCLEESERGGTYHVRHRLLGEDRTASVWAPAAAEESLVGRAREASRLAHPNIARVVDFSIEDDGSAWMITEMVVGADLAEVAGAGLPLDPGLLAEIGIQVCRALGYVHGRGFPLRGLDPTSFVLTRSPEDEPLVQLVGLVDRSGAAVAPDPDRWIPPEGAEPSPASDLWIAARILRRLAEAGRGRVPEPLAAILERGEAVDPESRWPSAGAMGRAFVETGLASGTGPGGPGSSVPALLARLRDTGSTRVLNLGDRSVDEAGPSSLPEAPPEEPPADAVDEDGIFPETVAVRRGAEPLGPAGVGAETVLVRDPASPGPGSSSVDLQLIDAAGEARRIGDLDRAAEVLDRALENHPDSRRLARLREEVENERRALEERERRERELRQETARIRELLESGDLVEARRRLDDALASWSPSDALEALDVRLDALEEERQALRAGLLERARDALEEERFREAEAALDELDSSCPGDAEGSRLRSELARRVLAALESERVPPPPSPLDASSPSTLAVGPPPEPPPAPVEEPPPDPPSDASLEALLRHADRLVSTGSLERALETLSRAQEIAPDHDGVLQRRKTLTRLSRMGFRRAGADGGDFRTRPHLEEPPDLPAPPVPSGPRLDVRDRPVAEVTLHGWSLEDLRDSGGPWLAEGPSTDRPEADADEPSLVFSAVEGPSSRPRKKRSSGPTRWQWILLAILVAVLAGVLGAYLARKGSEDPGSPIRVEDVAGPEIAIDRPD